MTDLPNGFSRDFSEAPRDVAFIAYFAQEHWDGEIEPTPVWAWFDEAGALESEVGPLPTSSPKPFSKPTMPEGRQ